MEVIINGERFVPQACNQFDKSPLHVLAKQARKAKQETLEQAAAGIGTSKSYMWELEQGRSNPTLSLLQRILKYYGISFEQIS